MGTTELDRPVPLYMQVVRQLRAQIAAGELADGDRIPSQREMMARWRISMQTASKVIGALKTEGLAIASAGKAAAPAHVAEILGIPSGRRALYRRETRTGEGGQAISTTTTWFPPAVADKAPRLA